MLFKIRPVEQVYDDEQEINRLKDIGFKFELHNNLYYNTFILKNDEVELNIDTLEQLIDFQRKYGDLILDDNNTILIYNASVE